MFMIKRGNQTRKRMKLCFFLHCDVWAQGPDEPMSKLVSVLLTLAVQLVLIRIGLI